MLRRGGCVAVATAWPRASGVTRPELCRRAGRGRIPGGCGPRWRGRVRVPAPLIGWRPPSGRGATEQPNASGDGDAPLTPVFWLLIVLTGAAAGLFGDLMMLVLFNVEHLAFGYHSGTLEAAVRRTPDYRRLVVLAAGVFGGAAWFLLRRFTAGEKSEIDDVVWGHGERLSFRRSLGTSVISEIVIRMGASIGRENAPKLMGGASASVLAGWERLSAGQRRLLMACGGGAVRGDHDGHHHAAGDPARAGLGLGRSRPPPGSLYLLAAGFGSASGLLAHVLTGAAHGRLAQARRVPERCTRVPRMASCSPTWPR